MSTAKRILAVAAAGALALGGLSTTMAQTTTPGATVAPTATAAATPTPASQLVAYSGIVKSVTATALVVTTKKGDQTAALSGDTKYHSPGVASATVANVTPGSRAAVLAQRAASGDSAVHVNVVPSKPIAVHRVGTVTAYTAGSSITIQDNKGETSTFVLDGQTQVRLQRGATSVAVGDQVTVLARRVPSSDTYTAKTVMTFGAKKTPPKGPPEGTPGAQGQRPANAPTGQAGAQGQGQERRP